MGVVIQSMIIFDYEAKPRAHGQAVSKLRVEREREKWSPILASHSGNMVHPWNTNYIRTEAATSARMI